MVRNRCGAQTIRYNHLPFFSQALIYLSIFSEQSPSFSRNSCFVAGDSERPSSSLKSSDHIIAVAAGKHLHRDLPFSLSEAAEVLSHCSGVSEEEETLIDSPNKEYTQLYPP